MVEAVGVSPSDAIWCTALHLFVPNIKRGKVLVRQVWLTSALSINGGAAGNGDVFTARAWSAQVSWACDMPHSELLPRFMPRATAGSVSVLGTGNGIYYMRSD